MTYAIFVDFDGVLATQRQTFGQIDEKGGYYPMWASLDPVAMDFFNRIHRTFEDVEFVWTTTWRNHMPMDAMTLHWAYSMWYSAGFRGLFAKDWKVNTVDDASLHGRRDVEIKNYLASHKIEDFIIFDDSDYGFNRTLGKKRFIKTSSEDGILTRHMMDAWSLTGNWKKK